jgi:hypothetical protein
VSSPILTYKQAKALSDRQFEAAKCLSGGKHYGQSVARAYYSLYTLTHFIARRQPTWHWYTRADGSERATPPHEDTPGYVLQCLQVTASNSLDIRQARINTQELLTQRVAADYFGYQDIPEETARRLLQNCLAIRSVLLDTAHQCQNDPIR